MIDYATDGRIRTLRQDQQLTAGQIARQLHVDKKTVRYWLGHDYHLARRPQRGSKLDPDKPRVKAWRPGQREQNKTVVRSPAAETAHRAVQRLGGHRDGWSDFHSSVHDLKMRRCMSRTRSGGELAVAVPAIAASG